MKDMDADESGQISKDEFKDWWPENGRAALANFAHIRRDLLMALATPVKIIFGFAQIIGQLDSVLQITLPETITSIIGAFKPLVANIWQSFLPVGCIASLDFYQRWISTVFIVPSIGLFAAYLWYAGRRLFCSSQKESVMSKAEAVQQLRGNVSLVIFFLYPNVSCRVHRLARIACTHKTADASA